MWRMKLELWTVICEGEIINCEVWSMQYEVIDPIQVILKIEYRLSRRYWGVCSLANYNVAQSNRVSDFRDFVCSLFSNAILFYFYFKLKL